MSCLCNPRIYFTARKMSALTRFSTLCHFNLNFFCILQVMNMNTETSRCNLLNSTAAAVTVFIRNISFRVFTALTAVWLTAKSVHCDCKTFVCFLWNWTVWHSTGLETLNNAFHAFNLIYCDWLINRLNIKHTANCALMLLMFVHFLCIFFIKLVVTCTTSHL